MLRVITTFTLAWILWPAGLKAQQADPLGGLVAEALHSNLGLKTERLSEERTDAQVREARGLFLPALTLDSRYTAQSGTLNLGDVVNPVYSALNQIRGSNQFPTNLDVTVPTAYDSRLRLAQPLFNETIRRNYSLARHRSDGQRYHRLGAARHLAADVQTAYLTLADARSAVAIYDASLRLVTEAERVADRLLAAGKATPAAVFRAAAERSDVTQKLSEAREQASAAARALNQVLGRDLDAPAPEIPDSALAFDLAIPESTAVAHALARREELDE